ncbi:50S ribosomal protein HLL [Citrus sinensis]|nr:50S ribosomal protein HLL [Citrus sinensis]
MAASLASKWSRGVGRALFGGLGNNLSGLLAGTFHEKGASSTFLSRQRRSFIQMGTVLKVADNSGAKTVTCIHPARGKKVARLGDTIIASVKELHQKKGERILSANNKGDHNTCVHQKRIRDAGGFAGVNPPMPKLAQVVASHGTLTASLWANVGSRVSCNGSGKSATIVILWNRVPAFWGIAVVVRTAMPFSRCDGSVIKFDENAIALLNKHQDYRITKKRNLHKGRRAGRPIQKRVFGPVPYELRKKWMLAILTLVEDNA